MPTFRIPERPESQYLQRQLVNYISQIHVYGGHRYQDADGDAIVDNYYILSLPQFIWTRAPSLSQPLVASQCDLLGTHRMVITDGVRRPGLGCQPLLKILDLNTGATINTFADEANYTVPHYVAADIGGKYVYPPLFSPRAPALLTEYTGILQWHWRRNDHEARRRVCPRA